MANKNYYYKKSVSKEEFWKQNSNGEVSISRIHYFNRRGEMVGFSLSITETGADVEEPIRFSREDWLENCSWSQSIFEATYEFAHRQFLEELRTMKEQNLFGKKIEKKEKIS